MISFCVVCALSPTLHSERICNILVELCSAIVYHVIFFSLCVKLLSFIAAQQLGKGCYVRVLWVSPTDRQMSLFPFPGRAHRRQSSLASFVYGRVYTSGSLVIQLRRLLSTIKKPNRA